MGTANSTQWALCYIYREMFEPLSDGTIHGPKGRRLSVVASHIRKEYTLVGYSPSEVAQRREASQGRVARSSQKLW